MWNKQLNEMTTEELWQLFPICLVPHRDEWSLYYKEEKVIVENILEKKNIKLIAHIGSTAIPFIMAKNIVDILIIVETDFYQEALKRLIDEGYLLMRDSKDDASLNKGYTNKGYQEKVYHLHLRSNDNLDELYFRDYLCEFPEVAKEYEAIKIELWHKFEHDRDQYTSGKSAFIKDITNKAHKLYGSRYWRLKRN